MAKNHNLAGAVLDCGFHEIRRQLQYKAEMRGGHILVADRFARRFVLPLTYRPKGREELDVERWICSQCGAQHKRDANAAINLRRVGLAEAELTCGDTAPLPVSAEARQASRLNRKLNWARTCART
jgi:putative transposase